MDDAGVTNSVCTILTQGCVWIFAIVTNRQLYVEGMFSILWGSHHRFKEVSLN